MAADSNTSTNGQQTQPAAGDQTQPNGAVARALPRKLTDWSKPMSPRKWIVEGWMPARAGMLTGVGGLGKSTLALQIAAALAQGPAQKDSALPYDQQKTPGGFAEMKVPQGGGKRILFASWEDEDSEARRRFKPSARTPPTAAKTSWITTTWAM